MTPDWQEEWNGGLKKLSERFNINVNTIKSKIYQLSKTNIPNSNICYISKIKDVKVEEPAAVATPDFTAGEVIYTGKGMCATCHQAEGQGLAPAFPPLANADYLLADVKRAIKQTMYGAKTPITVNGQEYPGGIMTTVELTDQEVMDVVNYILNQEEHHKKQNFKSEYLQLLNSFKIDYDEKYLFHDLI